MPRALLALLFVAVCAAGAAPAGSAQSATQRPWLLAVRSAGATKAPPDEQSAYLVVLADPPLARAASDGPGAALSPAAADQLRRLGEGRSATLAAISAALGRPAQPLATFSYALNGVSLTLTPAEAAAVAALPGVRLVQRDQPLRTLTDVGPARIGAAQADLRPAILFARLAGPAGAAGRAEAAYDAAAARLAITVAATGLDGPPTGARLVLPRPGQPATAVADLTPLLAGDAPAFAGAITLGAAPGLTPAAVEAALLDGKLELRLATAAAPGGALSGALLPARGEGVIAAVIDSGVNPFSPSFGALDSGGAPLANPLGPGVYRGVCDPADLQYRSDFPCNSRLIGAYTFLGSSGRPDPQGRPSPFDDDGHGSHTAATLAGSLVGTVDIGGTTLGPVAGVAPHAALIAYDVCAGGGCSVRASVAAIDQAVADGAAVINYSIGAPPQDPWGDATALAMLGALEAGVLTSAAAGNDGPGAASVGSPANAPWVMAVGATAHGRRIARVLADFSGGAGPPPPPLIAQGLGAAAIPAAPIVAGATLPNIFGQPNSTCQPFDRAVQLAGAIVVCRVNGFAFSMASSVARAGGAALVVVWPPFVGRQLPLQSLDVPTVHLDANSGQLLLDWLARGAGHRASLGGAARDMGGPDDSVATFSSRGPDLLNPDALKPDLAAPGLNVLSADADFDAGGDDYLFLSGTSMAAPHAAGAVALLRQIHPDWRPGELRSALMTTAQPAATLADETSPATAHDIGAGRLRVDLAARAGLLLDESGAAFRAADPALGGDPAALNLPGLSRAICLEQCVFTRTVRSALGAPGTWAARAEAEPGVSLAVSPPSFSLAPGATQTLVITATIAREAMTPEGIYRFGAVLLEEASGLAPPTRLPAAIGARASVLPTTVFTRTTAATGSLVVPGLRSVAAAELTVRLNGLSRGGLLRLNLGEDLTPTDPFDGGPGIYSTTLRLPAGTARLYVAVERSTSPDIDLLIFADGEGGPADGAPQLEELVCLSAALSSDEHCDLLLRPGAERPMIVLVQNYSGSGAAEDSVDLRVNLVPGAAVGNMSATGPAAVATDQPYSLSLGWSLPDSPEGVGLYQGVIELSSTPDPARAGDLGRIPIDLAYMRGLVYLPATQR